MHYRYHQAYIPLPLEGAVINHELAKTFHMDDSSSVSRSSSLPLTGKTRYKEDFCTLVSNGKEGRGVSCKPKIRTHARPGDHLIYVDSVSHEKFPDFSSFSRPRDPFTPSRDRPTNASAGFKFNAGTRYAEEFVDVSNSAYKIEAVRLSDNSNRVHGNSIPNKLRDYLYNRDVRISEVGIPMEELLRSPAPPPKAVSLTNPDNNPYIDEYLSYHRIT